MAMSDFPPPPDSPPYFAPPPRRGIPSGVVIAVGVTAAVVITAIAGGLALYVGSRLPRPAASAQASGTPSPRGLTASSGTVLFSDDFHDPASGWDTTTRGSGTTFTYRDGTFVIVSKGDLYHPEASPYTVPVARLSQAITATQSNGAPGDAGFGVECVQGNGAQQLSYNFVLAGGIFYISRHVGPDTPTNFSTTLKQGTAHVAPGLTPVTVVGDCIMSGDGTPTRLVLFVNGEKAADVTDTATVPSTGWTGGIVTASDSFAPSTDIVTRFEERDLSR